MAITQYGTKVLSLIKKYRYAALILLVGLVFMWMPGRKENDTSLVSVTDTATDTDITAELTDILTQIEGVGKVKVMLTIEAGEYTIYQSDENSSGETIRTETVIITDSDRNEHPLISQIRPVTYRGAIIVCQGADSPATKLAIVEAVSRVTGLGADCISVLKMK